MERNLPSCEGCGAEGHFLCGECRQPAHDVEAVNRNVRQPSHNDRNF